jgi:hypothetical protein
MRNHSTAFVAPGVARRESSTGATLDRRLAVALAGLGAIVAAVAFAYAFVMTQTQPRLESAAAGLVGATPWWALARQLRVLVPDSPRTVAAAVVVLQVLGFGAYVIGIAVAWGARPTRGRLMVVVAATLLAWGFVAAALPTLDTDIFSYIAQGRVAAVHGANPEVVAPAAFPTDPFLAFVSPEYRGIVGDNKLPLWSDVTALLAGASGGDVVRTLLVYRLLFLAVDAVSLALIAVTLARGARDRLLAGLVTFGWSPIVVETGQSKVDALMACLVLAAVLCLVVRRPRLAVASLGLSVLVKLITLPLLVVRLAGEARRAEWRVLAADAAIVAVVAAVAYAPFWPGPAEVAAQLGLIRNGGSILPGILRPVVEVLFVALLAWLAWRDDGLPTTTVRHWTIVMLFFGALLTTPGLSWYLITMVALTAVSGEGSLVAIGVGIAFVSFAFDRVQRFELVSPIEVSRGVVYLVVAGIVVSAVAIAVGVRGTGRRSGSAAA